MYFIKKGLTVFIGSILIAIGINAFLTPYEVLDGGIIGLSLIFNYLFQLKIGLMIIVFSIPIFILAWFKYRPYFYNSIHGLLISSVIIDILKPLRDSVRFTPLHSAILGGLFVGIGTGIMLRFETSTGGTDLLAQFISNKIRLNVGIIIFIIDSIVICLGGLLVSEKTLLLSVITILCVGISTSSITSWHR